MHTKLQTHENSNWFHSIVKNIQMETYQHQRLQNKKKTPNPQTNFTNDKTKQPLRIHMIKRMQIGPFVLHQLPIKTHHTSENKTLAVHKMLTTKLKVPVGLPRKRPGSGGLKDLWLVKDPIGYA